MSQRIAVALLLTVLATPAGGDEGRVVEVFTGCDYFIADGPSGLYVLEWYGGHLPREGDAMTGDIGSYGFKDVVYNGQVQGRVWVEDYLASTDSALDEIAEHCSGSLP